MKSAWNRLRVRSVYGSLVAMGLAVPMLALAQQTVTTTGGTTGYIPKFTGASTVANSLIFDTGSTVGIGVGATPNSSVKLDIGGGMIVRGNTIVSRVGNATSSKGQPSWAFQFYANAYNSSTKAGDNPYFSMQSEPTGNNTASPSATFNLLFSNNGAASAETGFYINPNGTLHFASAQTFPIAAGPQGPQGPTGAQGPAGSQGPASTLTLPYTGVVANDPGGPGYAFQVTNSSPGGGDGIIAYGSPSGTNAGGVGSRGVIGVGGASDPTAATTGGRGLTGLGGPAQNAKSVGGAGGYFVGGIGNNSGIGGDGIDVFFGSSDSVGSQYDGVAIYAYGALEGRAGEFYGNVDVAGSLSKSSGSFKIDHPLDPSNKYLYHSFVESPDMKNVYDGTVTTDSSGTAQVTMPDYFEALNRDYRYQLTVIGQFAQAIVGSEISNGAFTIRTDKPGVKVSWQVTGIRQDAWANAHRIPLEQDKPEKEKGHFIHPELFGHAGEESISEMGHPRPSPREQH